MHLQGLLWQIPSIPKIQPRNRGQPKKIQAICSYNPQAPHRRCSISMAKYWSSVGSFLDLPTSVCRSSKLSIPVLHGLTSVPRHSLISKNISATRLCSVAQTKERHSTYISQSTIRPSAPSHSEKRIDTNASYTMSGRLYKGPRDDIPL